MTIQGKRLSRNRLARVYCAMSLQGLLWYFRSNQGRLRGINKGSINVDNFAGAVTSFHLANVEKQIKVGDLLDLGKKKYSGGSSCSTFFWN